MADVTQYELIEQYIKDNLQLFVYRPGYDYEITQYIDERKLDLYKLRNKLISIERSKRITSSQLYERSLISKATYYNIIAPGSKPEKNTIIKIIFGCELDINDASELLNYSGYTLSCANYSDLIIRYFLENRIYDLEALNIYLEKFNQRKIPLGD